MHLLDLVAELCRDPAANFFAFLVHEIAKSGRIADSKPVHRYNEEFSGEWWYYNQVLAKGDKTSNLHAGWTIPEDSDLENFDVVVVHESAVATYKDGKVAPPEGWDYIPTIPAE